MLRLLRLPFFAAFFAVSVLALGQTTAPASPVPPPLQATDKLSSKQKLEIVSALADIIEKRMFVPGIDVKQWPSHLAKHQENIDNAETVRDFVGSINRAFREFGISHLRLRTPSATRNRRNGPVATGFGISGVQGEGGIVVRVVVPNSPAFTAGIQVGDTILEVDGRAIASIEALSGETGTSAKLKVKRASGEIVEIEVRRTQYSTARKETLRWLDEETAVLRVFTFSQGYSRSNLEALLAEANKKAKYLVLDLRSNGGGATNNLRHLLSLLLPKDTVVGTFVNKREAEEYAKAHPNAPADAFKIAESSTRKFRTSTQSVPSFTGKIAVLINRGSASASEICSAGLREAAHAPLIGAKTAGAVLASVYGKLPHGFEVQYPITDYITAKGMRLEGNPLVPDYEVPTVPVGEKDEALEKAVSILKSQP